MSPTQMAPMQMATYPQTTGPYHHPSHGVTKNKKVVMTGGGRAWREDEEAYLLQTRMQKMPYKHIAAHLKKTELACRLHYHQLSHGSARRKRAASFSSGSSDHSPVMHAVHDSPLQRSESRSISPSTYPGHYNTTVSRPDMQLPRVMSSASPRLPAILPKPVNSSYPQDHRYQSYEAHEPLLPPVQLHRGEPVPQSQSPPLRLNCSGLPPPSASVHQPEHVDLSRLYTIYDAYKNSFWSAVANEYGRNTPASALEKAWKTGVCCPQHGHGNITPGASPARDDKPAFGHVGQDRTRIASILSA